MLDALFSGAFCLSTLFGLLLTGSSLGDDFLTNGSAVSPETESTELPIGAQSEFPGTEQTLLSGEELPFLPVPDESLADVENQQASVEALQKSNSIPARMKEDTFLVYSYLNYVTMSCVSALDDPDQFPRKLFYFASTQQSENVQAAADDHTFNSSKLKQGTADESSSPLVSRRRPMTAIRLSDSIVQLDESGQPLAKPEDSGPQQSTAEPAEHHFVPAPWHRSHASRNTYPIRYQPLYFEDPNMERCGETGGCLTEFKSIAHFAGRIPLLPYMMASNSPHQCVGALPDCPTCQKFGPDACLPKPTVKAIAVQAAATVGAVYIIP